MAGLLLKAGIPVALSALLYQTFLKRFLLLFLGIGRVLQPIEDFPYQCRRIEDTKVQACEDMWLSESNRVLFLACSDPLSRLQWMPNVALFNASGRGLNDAVVAMSIDKPRDAGFEYDVLASDWAGKLNLVGMSGVDGGVQSAQLYLVNARPSIDATKGVFLDNAKVGANATIEEFVAYLNSGKMAHLRTTSHPQMSTPNKMAIMPDGSFYFTNDHGPHKAGFRHTLSDLLGHGDVSYCAKGECKHIVGGYKFPNGLARGQDGRIYVPSSVDGGIVVYEPRSDHSLKQVDYIDIPYGIDNLSVDSNGDIWVPAFPILRSTLSYHEPFGQHPPTTIIKVSRNGGSYEWRKVIEDRDAAVIGMTTAVIHDAKTGRLFMSGISTPFITVCDPK